MWCWRRLRVAGSGGEIAGRGEGRSQGWKGDVGKVLNVVVAPGVDGRWTGWWSVPGVTARGERDARKVHPQGLLERQRGRS